MADVALLHASPLLSVADQLLALCAFSSAILGFVVIFRGPEPQASRPPGRRTADRVDARAAAQGRRLCPR